MKELEVLTLDRLRGDDITLLLLQKAYYLQSSILVSQTTDGVVAQSC